MNDASRIIAAARAYRSAHRLTKWALAKQAGLGDTTINRIDDPDWNPTRRILDALARATPAEFFEDPASTDAQQVSAG